MFLLLLLLLIIIICYYYYYSYYDYYYFHFCCYLFASYLLKLSFSGFQNTPSTQSLGPQLLDILPPPKP